MGCCGGGEQFIVDAGAGVREAAMVAWREELARREAAVAEQVERCVGRSRS